MSTETTPDRLEWPDLTEEGRFQRRLDPPDRLYGPPRVNYPASDGRPMSDNTLQERVDRHASRAAWRRSIRDDPKVFIASNLMWYPVKGNNRRRLAPDVMVAFGRPKGYRESYIQHRERGVAPQVVFEILSPGNRKRVMDFKRTRYEAYGVEEYYVFDPYEIGLEVWLRRRGNLPTDPRGIGFGQPPARHPVRAGRRPDDLRPRRPTVPRLCRRRPRARPGGTPRRPRARAGRHRATTGRRRA